MTEVMTPSDESVTTGQSDKLYDLFSARLRKSKLSRAAVQKEIAEDGDAIADEMVAIIAKRIEAKRVLIPRGKANITLANDHDPSTFYQTCPRLWVDPDLRSRVVAKAKPSKAGLTHNLVLAELAKDLTDAEIEAALPGQHLWGESEACAVIAGLIALQPNGEEGTLINNGRVNLFYLGSCVVGVRWFVVVREWFVGAWRRDGDRWSAGDGVFSPAVA